MAGYTTKTSKKDTTTVGAWNTHDTNTSPLNISDNRPEVSVQNSIQDLANNCTQTIQLQKYQELADGSIINSPPFILQRAINHSLIQLKGNWGESETPNGLDNNSGHRTRLPNPLKSGIEKLSGLNMADVGVYHNSAKPAQLNALAYAQGTDIHLASGQERCLPHEAWHVVQQKQGRVKSTRQMKSIAINDESHLEKEADVMGAKALHVGKIESNQKSNSTKPLTMIPQLMPVSQFSFTTASPVIQRAKAQYAGGGVIPANIDGERDRNFAAPANYTAHNGMVTAGVTDYLKATNYDAATATPMGELLAQLNNHYKGKNTGLVAPNNKVPNLTGNKTSLASPVNATFRRPYEVQARTSASRGVGRSNNSGIETNVGRMGQDEYKIRHGAGTAGGMEGGHLVGDQIMDSHENFLLYEDWNLAPQHSNFNAPIYLTTMENAAVGAIAQGGDLVYTVNLQYPDNNYVETASNLAARAGLWAGNYGVLLNAAIVNGEPDQNLTFRRRVPGYWKTTMVEQNNKTYIDSSVRDDLMGTYKGTAAGVLPTVNYNPGGGEVFRYTATADGTVLGPLGFGKQWNIQGAKSLTLTTRQETP